MKTQAPPQSGQPWLKNRRWASGRVRDQSSKFIIFCVIFSLIFNTIAVLAFISVWHDHSQGAALFVFPILLIALGLLMLAWTIRQIRVRMKFGRSVFEMETVPGVIGGWLAGTIRAPVLFDAAKGFRLELECVERVSVITIDGKSSQQTNTLLHAGQHLRGDVPRDGDCTCIPIAFEIPHNAKWTGRHGKSQIFWRLRARSPQPGADYDAQFIVPVFEVPGASTDAPQADSVAAPLRTSHKRLAREED